jgi:hypothetical protein
MATDAIRVSNSIDLIAEVKQIGHLEIPHSRNDSAWGAVER